jgi:hypothetical protein
MTIIYGREALVVQLFKGMTLIISHISMNSFLLNSLFMSLSLFLN